MVKNDEKTVSNEDEERSRYATRMDLMQELEIIKLRLHNRLLEKETTLVEARIAWEQQRFSHAKKQTDREELAIESHNKKLDMIQTSIDSFCERMTEKIDTAISDVEIVINPGLKKV